MILVTKNNSEIIIIIIILLENPSLCACSELFLNLKNTKKWKENQKQEQRNCEFDYANDDDDKNNNAY